MEFNIGDAITIFLPSLHITIMAIIIIFLLVRWSKQVETGRFKIFFYFLISTYVAPVVNLSTEDGVFKLWIPLGFTIVFIYLIRSKRNHPSKIKASILGLCISIYQLVLQYVG
nr:hypothetical protein [Jeotgalibacillus campisalis]